MSRQRRQVPMDHRPRPADVLNLSGLENTLGTYGLNLKGSVSQLGFRAYAVRPIWSHRRMGTTSSRRSAKSSKLAAYPYHPGMSTASHRTICAAVHIWTRPW